MGWFKLRVVTATVAVVAAGFLSAASTSAAPSRPLLGKCASSAFGGTVRPAAWKAGCAGAGRFDMKTVRWTSWGARSARGAGTTSIATCQPDCASSPSFTYPMRARLSRPRRCQDQTGAWATYFTRVTYRYRLPAANPVHESAGSHTINVNIFCLPG